ncbi:MAG: enoyl-CoA hydratase/isomerase family protein [Hyphomicrobiaceae bacterium]
MGDTAGLAGEPGSTGTGKGLSIGRRGAAGLIVLDRSEAQNALTVAMRAALAEAFPRWARDPGVYAVVSRSAVPRAFCVGGDIREMSRLMREDPARARAGLAEELRLCWLHECFSKPTVSLIDGAVMGTGVGISLYGTHRVAGAGYRFAMPEVRLGYFPDCAVTHAFARMPDHIGLYLALTGRTIGPADAYHLGLVTHCLDASHFAAIEARIAEADPVDPILDDLHQDPGPAPIAADAARIARYFGHATLTATLADLGRAPAADQAWAAAVLSDLARASPLALRVTDAAVRRAAALDLRETLAQDYRLAWRFVEAADVQAGVKAVLVEKSGTPAWQHATVEAVSDAAVEAFFGPLGPDELALPTRAAMQAARV